MRPTCAPHPRWLPSLSGVLSFLASSDPEVLDDVQRGNDPHPPGEEPSTPEQQTPGEGLEKPLEPKDALADGFSDFGSRQKEGYRENPIVIYDEARGNGIVALLGKGLSSERPTTHTIRHPLARCSSPDPSLTHPPPVGLISFADPLPPEHPASGPLDAFLLALGAMANEALDSPGGQDAVEAAVDVLQRAR